MNEIQLYQLLIATINAHKAAFGIPTILVKQAGQPTAQGANTAPTAYLQKVTPDTRRGQPGKREVYNVESGFKDQSQEQQLETMFQCSVLATQNPADLDALTANDMAGLLVALLQSDRAIDQLAVSGVGIYRIGDVRMMPVTNDRDQFQYEPSFDFILTHKQVIVLQTPIAVSEEVQIKTV